MKACWSELERGVRSPWQASNMDRRAEKARCYGITGTAADRDLTPLSDWRREWYWQEDGVRKTGVEINFALFGARWLWPHCPPLDFTAVVAVLSAEPYAPRALVELGMPGSAAEAETEQSTAASAAAGPGRSEVALTPLGEVTRIQAMLNNAAAVEAAEAAARAADAAACAAEAACGEIACELIDEVIDESFARIVACALADCVTQAPTAVGWPPPQLGMQYDRFWRALDAQGRRWVKKRLGSRDRRTLILKVLNLALDNAQTRLRDSGVGYFEDDTLRRAAARLLPDSDDSGWLQRAGFA